uniref:Uncharacterized protein n=1 Tax=viral metagenome TaxID=1070528 RepID=A0A6C0AMT4_9ZZZZ
MNYFYIFYYLMSFVSKCVNYSQCFVLKNKILQPLLKMYNDFLLKQKISNDNFCLNKDINTGVSSEFIIPNNNIKYYLFITNKSKLETTREKYNTLYFFPDSNSKLDYQVSDFYLEIDERFKQDYLLEGYLYKRDDNKLSFLITDILIINNDVIIADYNMRLAIINEIIMDIDLCDLNNHMNINLHPIFQKENENLIKVFKNNFIFKSDICCIESINNFIKTRYVDRKDLEETDKIIEIGKYTDVYNIYDTLTNNYIGILYIKGLKQSKAMKNLLLNKNKIILRCKFNNDFKKWEPII